MTSKTANGHFIRLTTLLFVVFLLATKLLSTWSWSVCIVAAGVPSVVGHMLAVAAYRVKYTDRATSPWMHNVVIDSDGQWVANEEVSEVLYVLSGDDDNPERQEKRIHVITRRHGIFLAGIPLLIVLALLCFYRSIQYSSAASGSADINGMEAGIWLIFGFAAFIATGCLWVWWKYWFLMVTDQRVVLFVSAPPILAVLWNSDRYPLFLSKVDTVQKRDFRFIGNMLGVGKVVVDSAATADKRFNNMWGWPKHGHIAKKIEAAAQAAQARHTAPTA
jgi:hypothetical protein